MRRHLAARLLPLIVLLVAIVATTAPLATFVLGVKELRSEARAAAEHVAEAVRREAQERPGLWRYDTIKLVEHLRAYAALPGIARVEVADARGVPIDLGVREDREVEDQSLVWEQAPIVLDGRPAGRAWVAASISSVQRSTALAAAIFAVLGLGLGAVLWVLPLRAVGRAEARIGAAQAAALQDAERRAIARELHDSVGQALTAVRLRMQLVEAAGDAGEAKRIAQETIGLTDGALAEVRRAVTLLGPSILDEVALPEALRRLADDTAERSQLAVDCRIEGEAPPDLSAALKTACYRIAQEALTNAVRHAKAGKVTLGIAHAGGTITLRIADDGRGFDPGAAAGAGAGLRGLRERVDLLGGRCKIDAAPGRGTTIEVELPV